MHGQGTFTSTKGTQYVGAWKHGKGHGEGTYTFASGNQYRGEWKNDSPWTGTEFGKYGFAISAFTGGVARRWDKVQEEKKKERAAYQSGGDATALSEYKTDADAQFALGLMYFDGQDVPQGFVYAHMWGHIAASNGNEDGRKLRDILATRMTPAQIEKAEKLASECVAKKYKGC